MIDWRPISERPSGPERKVLLWIGNPSDYGWRKRGPKIGWWRHGPSLFSFDGIEDASHLVTHWAEIDEPQPE